MIIATISNQGKQTFIELPNSEDELRWRLECVDIIQESEKILLNYPDKPYQIRLFADDRIGQDVIGIVRKGESLALLNSVMQALENSNRLAVSDAIDDGCARSLRQLYEQIRPDRQDSQKLKLCAIMDTNSRPLQIHDCVVEKAIPMSSEEFSRLLQKPELFKNLFHEHEDLMYWDMSGIFHCILPYDKEHGDGLLIDTNGMEYPKFYQYVPGAKLLIEHHEAGLAQTAEPEETPDIDIAM